MHTHPDLHPCAHLGCTRSALRGRATCGVHAEPPGPEPLPEPQRRDSGGSESQLQPPAWPALEAQQLPGPFDLAIAQRDSLHRYLRLRAGYRLPDLTAELRTLRALTLTADDLAPAVDGAQSARDEIDAFLDMVSRKILENPSEYAE